MEREKKDLVFIHNVQSANEYEDTIKTPARKGKQSQAGLCHH
ncbi:hypothetical protein M084_4881 [Bacteroides fragilis str. 3988 T1]|nr:hypothetical protein M084_4881 [Bacteroides fragilis str. 3988 T1]